jgi:hypothetical protein
MKRLLDKLKQWYASLKTNRMRNGDVIYVNRGKYTHWGIYAGKNRVIHFSNIDGGIMFNARIHEMDIGIFSKGKTVHIAHFPENHYTTYTPRQTLKKAKSRIGEGGYNLVFNNREHFVFWCQTGNYTSTQVMNWCQKFGLRRDAMNRLDEAGDRIVDGINNFADKIENAIYDFLLRAY